MRLEISQKLGMGLAATGLVLLSVGVGFGDEPRGLGRLFRFGNKDAAASSSSSKPDPVTRPTPPGATASPYSANAPRPIFGSDAPGMPSANLPDVGAGSTRFTPTRYPSTANSDHSSAFTPNPATTSNAAAASTSAGGPKLRPQPRTTKAATEADPILTRVALGRTDDGKQFGMFLQVYSDGTVIDSEGVHHVGADVMQPLGQALQASELNQLKGHCGGPPTDFIEQVHITVYERYRGRLRANNFSFSGNPSGCDPSVRALHAAIEALQLKLSGPPVTTTVTTEAPAAPTLATDTQAPLPPALGLTVEQ